MGLIAHYPLNGNANDALGRYDGEIRNNVQWVDGKFGLCSDTTNTDAGGSIFIPHNEEMSQKIFGISEHFAVSCWVNCRQYVHYGNIWGKAAGRSFSNTTVGLWTLNGGMRFVVGSNVGGNPSGSVAYIGGNSTFSPSLNEWHHIVCQCDNGFYSLWVDGEYLGGQYFTSAVGRSENTSPIIISGARHPWRNEGVNGNVADVRFYDTPLSKREIRDLYQGKVLSVSLRSDLISDKTLLHNITPVGSSAFLPEDNAWSVEGSGNYIDTTYTPYFDSTNNEFTIATWFKHSSSTGAKRLFGARDRSKSGNPLIELFGGYTRVQALIRGNDGSRRDIAQNVSLDPNQFHHLAWVCSDGNSFLYLNGNLVGQNTAGYDRLINLKDVSLPIGGTRLESSVSSNQIDIVRSLDVFHTAFSADEVKELYQQKASLDAQGNFYAGLINSNQYIVASEFTRVVNQPFEIIQDQDRVNALATTLINTTNSAQSVEYDFFVPSENTYTISGWIIAVDGSSDSYNMALDGEAWQTWHTGQSTTFDKKTWKSINLTKGKHTLRVRARETNCKCAVWIIEDPQGNLVTPSKYSVLPNGITRSTISEVGITNGLVAYYPLRTSTKDFSGNGYDGVATGAIPVGGGFDGRGAYSFPSSENCRVAVEPDILDDVELDSFSVTVWVKPESHNNDWRYVYHRSSGTSAIIGGAISMLAITSANQFSASVNGTNYATSTDPVIVGETYFLSVVYSDGELKLFVNGEEKASRSVNITMNRTGKWAIGSAYYGSLGYRDFLGDISNVKIFNRALSPEEIAVEYKRTGVTKMTQHQGTTYIQGEFKEV